MHLDTQFPKAFEELQEIFRSLGCSELMGRCAMRVTQNINEAVMAKVL